LIDDECFGGDEAPILFDEFYGKWIFEIFPLVGSYRGQDGKYDVHHGQGHL
jgi:hypothetical protein